MLSFSFIWAWSSSGWWAVLSVGATCQVGGLSLALLNFSWWSAVGGKMQPDLVAEVLKEMQCVKRKSTRGLSELVVALYPYG